MSLLPDLRPHFRRFIDAAPHRIHVAAHSHHYWPDVTFTAQQRCWEDAARLADDKWTAIFDELIPRVQSGVAALLALPEPDSLAFAPNTHEFVRRLLSCLPAERVPRVLTTDAEFHSFARQATRLEEAGLLRVERVPVSPHATFTERFAAAGRSGGHDLVYLSHVFFDSGYVVPDLATVATAVPDPDTLVVVDGYHAFLALPVDLAALAPRVFYLAGGYKYAMAGEGACFLHCPPGQGLRPRDTGWFAAFHGLTGNATSVDYAPGGARFLGATFDPVGLYRLRAVLDWLDALDIGPAAIHAHAHALQARFVAGLLALGNERLHPDRLDVPITDPHRGNFLAFETPEAKALHAELAAAGVVTDYRGDRLRFGFGLYHQPEDVDRLLDRLAGILQ